jgi:hypothetical protein
VAEFVVELYASRVDPHQVERTIERARGAADELRSEALDIGFIRSLFVPDDETCLLLFEAASVVTVREAMERAGIAFERITEAVSDGALDRAPSATDVPRQESAGEVMP